MDKQPQESSNKNAKAITDGNFVPPRHWIGIEELEARYWTDSTIQEKRGQEFFEKPVEWIDKVDSSEQGGFARRDFLTVMGASMAMASFACARRPVHKIIPYVVKPEEIVPGVANWYATTCKECSAGCGVLAKNREGRPIKLEGNPDHPVNRGSLCSRGQASVLGLYDVDRLKGPIARTRGSADRRDQSWLDVDQAVGAKLKALANGAGRVRVLSGVVQGDSTLQLIHEFLGAFHAGEHIEFEPMAQDDRAEAQALSYGAAVHPHYRIGQAERIVSLGSDFLGTDDNFLEYSREWSKNRKLASKSGTYSKLVCFESHLTTTGANADERYPVRPGDELKIALALAHELILVQKRSNLAGDAAFAALLAKYQPATVAEEIGLKGGAEVLKKLAGELAESRGRSLIIAGSLPAKTRDAVALQVAVNLLNSVLENEGATVDGTANAVAARGGFRGIAKLISDMKAGQVDALIVYHSNPVYTLARNVAGFTEALKQVPLVVVVSDRDDETGQLADFVLPAHHYLENWGDGNPRPGLYSLQQPTIAPIHDSRAFEDMLLVWIRGAGLHSSGISARVASGPAGGFSWHEYLMARWQEVVYPKAGKGAGFEAFWESTLRSGVLDTRAGGEDAHGSARSFKSASLSALPKYAMDSEQGPLLALYAKMSMGDGRGANNPWLQELPDPISAVTWDNYLNVGPDLAKRLSLKDDDVVEVSSGGTKVELPVHVQPGLHPAVVTAAIGYGRTAVGKVGNGAGVDLYPMMKVQAKANGAELITSGFPVTLRKTLRYYKLASTQWHTAAEGRPIINDVTLAEYKANPAVHMETDPELRMESVPSMWPVHQYKGYRWGMAIDLNSCTGCGSCMIACQAENNIPVVGRDQVRVSRQMHWIRIDRYYSGSPENPQLMFQPMLCQHCENAPCETVCPVLATVHDDEGLNVQVYNRCVGTRYCQNNCPYKVRRFNFFDHWKSYEGTMNLAWNPDVTVRTRGIMEKCTFCVQRIRDARDRSKDAGEKIEDGSFQTACQQTCPTEAIVFGDINDPESRVSKLAAKPRAFRVLETLNTKPSISYLTKVRNREQEAGV